MEFYNKIEKRKITTLDFKRNLYNDTNILSIDYNKWREITHVTVNIILRNINFEVDQIKKINDIFNISDYCEISIKNELIYFKYNKIKNLQSVDFNQKIVTLLNFMINESFFSDGTKIGFFLNQFGDTFQGYDYVNNFLK